MLLKLTAAIIGYHGLYLVAGIYIHIPFCRQACIYCNFHFSTNLSAKEPMTAALLKELEARVDYLEEETVETIYFGGGTPSLLEATQLQEILNAVKRLYKVSEHPEITLEGNPDDLNKEKLNELAGLGINRLSIGIQSFRQQDLTWLQRVHSSAQSLQCIDDAQKAGIENITIDLIYGIPGQDDEAWMQNLQKVKELGLPHFSAYALTVEPKTQLSYLVHKKKTEAVDEDQMARQFGLMQQWVADNGYLAYEISNYCRPGAFSKHNTSYWQGKKYLGIGPSAHSYNGVSRQWNVANNAMYIKNIHAGIPSFEVEMLTPAQQYNEYIMTSLRTMWGVDKQYIKDRFGDKLLADFQRLNAGYISDKLLSEKDNTVILTPAGKLLADAITADLFTDE